MGAQGGRRLLYARCTTENPSDNVTFEQRLGGSEGGAVRISSRAFQAEGTVSAKALGLSVSKDQQEAGWLEWSIGG